MVRNLQRIWLLYINEQYRVKLDNLTVCKLSRTFPKQGEFGAG